MNTKPLPSFLVLVLLLLSKYSWAQDYLFNGSFEYGLHVNWTHTVKPGAVASMRLEDGETVKDGLVALEINLESRGGDTYGVASSTTAMVAGDSIYLLRFRARESKEFSYEGPDYEPNPDFARLIVTITGESGHKHEVLYILRQGSTTFHLPFKTFDKELTISFYPQTEGRAYYIDGVELLDQTRHKNIDVYNTYVWNNNRSTTGPTWLAGDNDLSYQLPDGRTLWVFNDSFISGGSGDVNDTTRNDLVHVGRFVRNAAVVEDVDGTLIDLGATDRNNNGQAAYFETLEEIVVNGSQKNFYWVGDMVMEGDMIKVYLTEQDETDGLHGTGRSFLASISYPELELVGIEPQASFGYGYETSFVEDDTIYLYKKNDGTFVARTPVGNYNGAEMWEFWNGSSWVKNPAAAVSIRSGEKVEDVIRLEENSYALVTGLGALSRNLYMEFAQSPQGPWTERVLVYTRPSDWQYWAYLPNFQKQLSNGNYSVTYSVNAFLPLFFSSWSFVDKFWYRQRHVQIDVLGLSPYSEGYDCAGVKGGDAYTDVCGVCVGGTTGVGPCVSGVATFYTECDYTGMEVKLGVGEYTLADLTGQGLLDDLLSSVQVMDGYTVQLFEDDNFTGNSITIESESVACLSSVAFDNTTTSIIVKRKGGVDGMQGTYVLQNKLTNLVMDVEDMGNPGSRIVQKKFSSMVSQQFNIAALENGYYTIANVGVGQLLQIEGSSVEPGVALGLAYYDITDLDGTISAQHSDSPITEGIGELIDNNTQTKYLTFHSSGWVQYQTPDPFLVHSYSITSANDAPERDPASWTLSGSTDGVNWTVLDQRNGQIFESRFQEKAYSIANNTVEYSYYRLQMNSKAANILQLAEWKLFATQEEDDIQASQQFVIQEADDGYFRIFNKNSDLLVEVLDNSEAQPGSVVRQSMDFGQESALWRLVNVEDAGALIPDCAGVLGGEATLDDCGVCVGGTTGKEACEGAPDCHGTIGGDAFIDECGTCVEGETGLEACNILSVHDNANAYQFYPNPVSGELHVIFSEEWEGNELRIFNALGTLVWRGVFQYEPIDIGHLPAGVYFLKAFNGRSLVNVKFLKK